MTKELLQQALIKWYDSGAENRDEFIALVEQALAQQDQPAAWTHHPNPVHHTGPFVEEHLRDVVERTKAMHAVLDSWVVRAQSGQVNIPCPLEFVGAEQPAQEQVVVQKRVRYESGDYSAWVEIPMSEADNQYRDCVEIRKLYTHPAPTQPAQEPVSTEDMASAYLEKHLWKVIDMAGMWPKAKIDTRTWRHAMVYAPTQPALTDDEILNCFYASKSEGMVSYMLAVGRAIEAHCRGGADK